jgi:phenylalanyl-tRNA synthetase alpha chain
MPPSRGPVPVVKKESTRDLVEEILGHLSVSDSFSTSKVFPDITQREIKAALDRLGSRSMVTYDTIDTEVVLLTAEAEKICEEGSHEYKVWELVKREGKVAVKDLPAC